MLVIMSFYRRRMLLRLCFKLCSNRICLASNKTTASTSMEEYFNGIIPIDAVEKRFMRSRGPGGQNVNMVNSKCEIRFNLDKAHWLSKEIKEEFRSKFARFVSEDGFVIVHSDKTRYQTNNLDDCFVKLRQMLEECAEHLKFSLRSPSKDDLEILKERLEARARRRLDAKRRQSEKKKLRSY